MAGIVPGHHAGVDAWRRHLVPRLQARLSADAKATLGPALLRFRESFWGLLLIVIVLGGIYGGIFTPTEAAAVAAVYAFFITVFVYRRLKLRDVPKVLLRPPT